MPNIVLAKAGNVPIDWNATGEKKVLQNVQNLLSTRQFEVAFDRGLGLAPEYTDTPSEDGLGPLTNEINELLGIYEPRAMLMSVQYADSKYQVAVKVTL